MSSSVIALLLVILVAGPTPADSVEEADLAPGAGLGLTTNRPRSLPARATLPVTPPASFPIPAGALGIAAVAGAVATGAGGTRRRSRGESHGAGTYDGDLRSVWGLLPWEQVIYLDTGGDGQVAVRIGPPDVVYVGVFVPGTGAGIEDTLDNAKRARSIHEAALRHADGADVAVIYALPFDAPDRVLSFPWSADCACNAEKAREGGARLAEFVAALDLDHRNVTVIGHSYGSTVVGAAFAYEGLGSHASTPVFLGSPGVLAGKAADLNAPGTVYAAQAWLDPIDLAGVWPIVSTLSLSAAGRDRLIHGLDPTAAAFGAQRITTGGIGHGSYFTDDKTLDALGRIIVGKQPTVTHQSPWASG